MQLVRTRQPPHHPPMPAQHRAWAEAATDPVPVRERKDTMSQPVTCDNCGQPTTDHYHVGGRVICAGCWDPFGEFDQVSEPACETPIDRS